MDPITAFWNTFLAHRELLEQITTADDPVYDDILSKLQAVHPKLYFEFCISQGANELIITADGNAKLFGLVHEIVEAAPEVEAWKIIALKPKLGFPLTAKWEGISVSIPEVRFQPMRDGNSGELDIVLFVPGLQAGTEAAVHNALLRAIDHGLGERRFAQTIRGTEVRALATEMNRQQTYPLNHLDEYVSQL